MEIRWQEASWTHGIHTWGAEGKGAGCPPAELQVSIKVLANPAEGTEAEFPIWDKGANINFIPVNLCT